MSRIKAAIERIRKILANLSRKLGSGAARLGRDMAELSRKAAARGGRLVYTVVGVVRRIFGLAVAFCRTTGSERLATIRTRLRNSPGVLKWIAAGAAVAVLVAGLAALLPGFFARTPLVVWTMVNVSGSTTLSDAHLLEFPNGRYVLIDTAHNLRAREYLIPFLEKKGITRLEKVIITNAKDSKAGGLEALLEKGIEVGSVNFNMPPKSVCDQERQWGCRHEEIVSRVRSWERHTTVWPMETGATLVETDAARLGVFISHDAVSPPVGPAALADATSLLELTAGDNRVLFASDLGVTLGTHLVENMADALDFNILKVPHFGTWTHAPRSFFEVIVPKLELALVPTIDQLWDSDRSVIARSELATVPTYLSQRHGNVEVRLFDEGFEVHTWQHDEPLPR